MYLRTSCAKIVYPCDVVVHQSQLQASDTPQHDEDGQGGAKIFPVSTAGLVS